MLKWQLMVCFETSFVLAIGPCDFPNQRIVELANKTRIYCCKKNITELIVIWLRLCFCEAADVDHRRTFPGGVCSCLGPPVRHFIIIPAPPETIQACWRSHSGSWQKPTKLVNVPQNTELSCYQTTSVCQLKCCIAVHPVSMCENHSRTTLCYVHILIVTLE